MSDKARPKTTTPAAQGSEGIFSGMYVTTWPQSFRTLSPFT